MKIGSRTLATYHYTASPNFYLEKLDYGNDGEVQYEYDNKGRLICETYEDGDTVTYQYDNDGALASVTDSATGITTQYFYDFTGRTTKYVETGTGYSHSVEYTYDDINNLSTQIETIDGASYTTSYTYDADNRVTSKTTDGITVEYTYDGFGRITQQVTKNSATTILTETYTFNGNSSQIHTHRTQAGSYDVTYTYTYDDNGNILTINDGTNETSYVYDSQNQLIRENNQAGGFTHTWTYDNAGNIQNRAEYAYTTGDLTNLTAADTAGYTYGDEDWGDLLTAYDGSTITYDGIGNPTTYDGYTLTWEHGRELATMSNGSQTWTYTYDANGMRTKRTDGTSTYTYVYNGSQLVEMDANGIALKFTYDTDGTPLTLQADNDLYYYVTNLQGDVTGILDTSGNLVASYTYDAWGRILSMTGSDVVGYNPLTYRGYVYDSATGLYYLQSRYYNPAVGRFINADIYASTGQGFTGGNMFAYCGNNPVGNIDEAGTFFFTVLGAVTGFVGGVVGAVMTGQPADTWFDAGVDGAVGGAISGSGIDAALVIVGTFGTGLAPMLLAGGIAYASGGIGNTYTTYASSNGTASDSSLAISFLIGGMFNLFSFGTSLKCAAPNLEEIAILGSLQLASNLSSGLGVSVTGALATAIATACTSSANPHKGFNETNENSSSNPYGEKAILKMRDEIFRACGFEI